MRHVSKRHHIPDLGRECTWDHDRVRTGATVTVGGVAATKVAVTGMDTLTVSMQTRGVLRNVLGKGQVTAVDALCILRAVAGLPVPCASLPGYRQPAAARR